MYKQKEKAILRVLLEKKAFMTSTQLSQRTGISQRSIRDIIASLKKSLKTQQDFYLISKPHYGYAIRFHDETKRLLYQERLDLVSNHLKHTNSLQRLILICMHLTMSKETVRIEDLEEALFISRTQVSASLKAYRSFLESFFVYVDIIFGKGIIMHGAEGDIRRSMGKLFLMHMAELLENENDDIYINEFMSVYKRLKQTMTDTLKKERKSISTRVIENLSINTAVSLCRQKNGYFLYDMAMEDYAFPNDLKKKIHLLLQQEQLPYMPSEEAALCYFYYSQNDPADYRFHPLTHVVDELNERSLCYVEEKTGFPLSAYPEFKKEMKAWLKDFLNQCALGYYAYAVDRREEIVNPIAYHLAKMYIDFIDDIAKIEFDHEQILRVSRIFYSMLYQIEPITLKVSLCGAESNTEKQVIQEKLSNMFIKTITFTSKPEDVDVLLCLDQRIDRHHVCLSIPYALDPLSCYRLFQQMEELRKMKLYRQFNIRINKRYLKEYTNRSIEKEMESSMIAYAPQHKLCAVHWGNQIQEYQVHIGIDPDIKENRIIIEKLQKPLLLKENKVTYILYVYTPVSYMQILANQLFLNDIFLAMKEG